jgi:hypothetical protein
VFPVVEPLTATARTPVVPLPTSFNVLVLAEVEVILPETLVTTTVLPAVFGEAGIDPPPVLSGAAPDAFSGEVPTLVTDRLVIVLKFGGCEGTSKLRIWFNPSIASVTRVVSVSEIAPGLNDPSVGVPPGAARGICIPLEAPAAPEKPENPENPTPENPDVPENPDSP